MAFWRLADFQNVFLLLFAQLLYKIFSWHGDNIKSSPWTALSAAMISIHLNNFASMIHMIGKVLLNQLDTET